MKLPKPKREKIKYKHQIWYILQTKKEKKNERSIKPSCTPLRLLLRIV